jgi:hypothetical protein
MNLLRELDERTCARVIRSLVAGAARTGAGWVPAAVSEEQVAEVLAFLTAAKRVSPSPPTR